jgi:hypothetical protein
MDPKDSTAWLRHFERNRRNRPEPDWQRPTPFPPPVAAGLARSLAHFQLGESGDGGTLLVEARRTWADDPDYIAALALFVAEEQEHARLLAEQVVRLGGTLVTRHWTHGWFRRVRRALGVRFEIQTLLVAEIIGTAYYRLLRSTGDTVAADVRAHAARRSTAPPLPRRPHRHRAARLATAAAGAVDRPVPRPPPGRRHRRLGRPPLRPPGRRHRPAALHHRGPQRSPELAAQAGGRIPSWSKRNA